MFECHRFECHRCLETSRIMSYVDSTCSLARWCLYLCHLSHLFPPCVHSCPLLSMCVLIPHTHFYNNLSSFEFRTGKMFFPTQVQIIPLLAFLYSPSILWKFRLSSDHYQQLHLPRKPRTDLTGFRKFVLAGHKGRWTREAAGEKKQDCRAQRSLLQRPGFVELMCLCEMMPEG